MTEPNFDIDNRMAELMGWKLCDRRAMGWGEGPPVWSTGDLRNPTRMWFSPSTVREDALMVARKLERKFPKVATALEICEALLS
jgi:hypothetical protein